MNCFSNWMWFLCKPSEKASRKGTAHTVCKSICSQIPNAFLVKLSSYPSLLSLRKNYETLSTHKPWHLEKSDETLFQGESNCTLTNQDGRTKCQPDKMATGQNANQRLAFCSDFFLWLAFCPSQLFGWHFVRTISTCFRILSEPWKMSSFEWVWVRLCTVSRFPPI